MSEQTNNFKEALNLLNSISEEHLTHKVRVLSLGKEINIKQLKTKQQKTILNTALGSMSSVLKLNFNQDLYKILLENCESKEIVDSLTLFDRMYIILALRSHMSDMISVTEEEETEDFSLNEILSSFEDYVHPSSETVKIEKNNLIIELEVDVPNFKLEMEYLSAMPSFKNKDSEENSFKNIVSETYIYEISKFIKNIKIGGKDLGYNTMGVNQKYSIVENLPASAAQAILLKINEWKRELNKKLTVTFKSGAISVIESDVNLLLSN